MQTATLSLLAGCLWFVVAQTTSFGSCEAFLTIDTIEGSSTDPQHPGRIDVRSWEYGVDRLGPTTPSSASSAGKANIHDLTIVKVMDKSSAKLFQSCVIGTHFNTAVLVVRSSSSPTPTPTPTLIPSPSPGPSGPGDYLKITLSNVVVSSVTVNGASSDRSCGPTETVTLSFGLIEFDYSAENGGNANGVPAHVGYDLKNNKMF
jgi:type VI secretion system secreted protein Hcp